MLNRFAILLVRSLIVDTLLLLLDIQCTSTTVALCSSSICCLLPNTIAIHPAAVSSMDRIAACYSCLWGPCQASRRALPVSSYNRQQIYQWLLVSLVMKLLVEYRICVLETGHLSQPM